MSACNIVCPTGHYILRHEVLLPDASVRSPIHRYTDVPDEDQFLSPKPFSYTAKRETLQSGPIRKVQDKKFFLPSEHAARFESALIALSQVLSLSSDILQSCQTIAFVPHRRTGNLLPDKPFSYTHMQK